MNYKLPYLAVSILFVCQNTFAGYAPDPGALHTMARRKLVDLKDFRIIWTAGPIPSEAFVVRTDRPQPLIDTVRGAMGALPYDEPDLWVDIGQPDGSAYTSVTREHYKDVIALRAADIAQRRGQGGRP